MTTTSCANCGAGSWRRCGVAAAGGRKSVVWNVAQALRERVGRGDADGGGAAHGKRLNGFHSGIYIFDCQVLGTVRQRTLIQKVQAAVLPADGFRHVHDERSTWRARASTVIRLDVVSPSSAPQANTPSSWPGVTNTSGRV